jgi:hypothetical protein
MGFFGNIFGKNEPAQTWPAQGVSHLAQELWNLAQGLHGKKVALGGVQIEMSGYMYALAKISDLSEKAQRQRRSSYAMRNITNEMFETAMVSVAFEMQNDPKYSLSDFVQITSKLTIVWIATVLPFAQSRQKTGKMQIEILTSGIPDYTVYRAIKDAFEPVMNFINLS